MIADCLGADATNGARDAQVCSGGPMSEVVGQHGWEEPETIQRLVQLPLPVEHAVAEYATRIHSTSLEVISRVVKEAWTHGYLSTNGDGAGPAAESAGAEAESAEGEVIERWIVLPFAVERAVADYADQHNLTSAEVISRLLQEALEQLTT
jgi:hypothetical protein